MSLLKLNLQRCVIPVTLLLLVACGEEDSNGLSFSITTNNAEEVARYGLDMAEIGSYSKDVGEIVNINETIADRSKVDESVNCNLIEGFLTGSVTVTGSLDPTNLTIRFVDCASAVASLSGVATVSQLTDSMTGIKTSTVDGSMTAKHTASGLSLGVSQFFYEKISDTNNSPNLYEKNFFMKLSVPILGSFSVDGVMSGDESGTVVDKPLVGSVVTMTGSNKSKVRLTSVGVNGYNLEVDADGDGIYESTLSGDGGAAAVFPW